MLVELHVLDAGTRGTSRMVPVSNNRDVVRKVSGMVSYRSIYWIWRIHYPSNCFDDCDLNAVLFQSSRVVELEG